MYQCPGCPEPFAGAQKLTCNHVLCHKCIEENTKLIDEDYQICCPYEKCHQNTPAEKTHKLKQVPQTKHRPAPMSYEKAMEEDLKDTAREMDEFEMLTSGGVEIDTTSGGVQTDTLNQVTQTEEQDCRHLNRSVQTEQILDEISVERMKLETTPKPSKSATEGRALRKLLCKLAKTVKNCSAIRGFSENETRDKINLDIANGQNETVQQFLQDNFTDDLRADRFIMRERESQGRFLVGIGTKITGVEDERVGNFVGQSPEQQTIQDFGTVTCLAEEDPDDAGKSQIFVLTSHHVIQQNQSRRVLGSDGNSGNGMFLSVYHNKFEAISEYYHGILGTYDVDEMPYNVDIAALKLSDHIEKKITSDECSCRLQELVNTFTGDDYDLRDMRVRKNGAATGVTCGKIIHPCYFLKFYEADEAGAGFLVASLDDQPFAQPGDSGSLVWSTHGQPIGIVSYYRGKFDVGENEVDAIFVVRLDYAIEALVKKGFIRNVTCKTHGSPIPVVKYREQPGRTVQGADVEPQPLD